MSVIHAKNLNAFQSLNYGIREELRPLDCVLHVMQVDPVFKQIVYRVVYIFSGPFWPRPPGLKRNSLKNRKCFSERKLWHPEGVTTFGLRVTCYAG
jgi:hypothetical protein